MPNDILDQLKAQFQNTRPDKPNLFHMHASRQGPAVSNEVMLSIKEYERNKNLKKIIGIQQPGGTVAKYLFYWLSGLNNDTVGEIFYRLGIDKSMTEVLPSSAFDFQIDDNKFRYVFVEPLFAAYKSLFELAGINYDQIKKLSSSSTPENLASLMTHYSVAILNLALSKKALPIIEVRSVNEYPDIYIPNLRYADHSLLKSFSKQAVIKKKRQKKHAVDFIKKDLSVYVKAPSKYQISRIINRFNSNLSHKNIKILPKDVMSVFSLGEVDDNSVMENICAVERQYKKCLTDNTVNSMYIGGESMVFVMFQVAARQAHDSYLAKQEFMRGFNYQHYVKLINDYPDLQTCFSAFRTWDTDLFPEFDTNFVFGLKYLAFDSTISSTNGKWSDKTISSAIKLQASSLPVHDLTKK